MRNTSLDDLVFEHRNKAYGAYMLRHLYGKHIYVSVFITASLFATLLGGPMIVRAFLPEKAAEAPEMVTVETIEIPSIDPSLPPPPPLPQIEPPKISSLKFIPPEIKPDEQVVANEKSATQDELKDNVISDQTVKADSVSLNTNINENKNDGLGDGEDLGFMSVQRGAEFTGGDLRKFLQSKLIYPQMARAAGIEGKVYLSFEVSPDAKIINVKVLKGLTQQCDAEAVKAIYAMEGLWRPGMQAGRPVKQTFKIDLKFKLED
jgi:periplasmic protein TonB